MKLKECAIITPGVFTNRVETSPHSEDGVHVKVLTLKEFNQCLGVDYRISQAKDNSLFVNKDKVKPEVVTDDKSLVLHIQTQKFVWFPSHYAGLLLTNNFLKLTFTQDVDLHFMEWLLNEHPTIQKQIALFTEGSVAAVLKLSNVKEIEVDVPALATQTILGKVAQLKKRKATLLRQKEQLEQEWLHHKMVAALTTEGGHGYVNK